ncbi:MAG: DUF2092 domain-containing protein [Candidatus Omnitrophica bacterium]|nr:DUF2092 domain-containing protein [Candidatus Omnitrophota bacterium]
MKIRQGLITLTRIFSAAPLLLMVSVYPASTESSPNGGSIDPKTILSEMSAYLGNLDQFGFHAKITLERTVDKGERAKTQEAIDAWIERPNRLHAQLVGDQTHRELIYDATLITLVDWKENVFSRLVVPNTIDSMLDLISEEYGITWPLADFLYPNPAKVLLEQVEKSSFVGDERVGQFDCHRLDFEQPNVDWRIWIEAGAHPIPRKVVIEYKNLSDSPTFTGVMTDWIFEAPTNVNWTEVKGLEDLIPVDFIHIVKDRSK